MRIIKVYSPFLGENLRMIRKSLNLTQQQVADKLGVKRATYTKWETNAAEPSVYFIKKLTEIFSVDFNTIFAD